MMTTATTEHDLETIGSTAGRIWNFLSENGPSTMSKLAKEIDGSRDTVMQSVGWLAREGKVAIENGKRSKTVRLI